MANDLVVSVGGNIRDLERAMKAAADQAEKRANEIEDKFNKINPGKLLGAEALAGLIKGAAAGFAIDKITDAFFSATREVAAFGETAKRVGLELQQFQELRLAGLTKGIDAKAFDSGLEGLAKLLNDARREENGLTELLGANNIKFKERNGEVISTNKALAIAADLINRAATEMDKIEIAEKFGLPKDFVPLLEGGANALAQLRRNAEESGNVLSKEVVDKAKAFDDAWREAWATWTTYGKSAIVTVGQLIADVISKAQALLALPGQVTAGIGAMAGGATFVPKTTEDLADLEQQAKDVQQKLDGIQSRLHPSMRDQPNNEVRRLKDDLQDLQNRIELGRAAVPKAAPNAPQPPARPPEIDAKPVRPDATVIPDKKKGGGGGSAGKSDAEAAQDRLDRYVESLQRQNSVLDAEIATFGKSNAERRAAVELAKAQVDLAKLDETSRQSVIAGLTKEIQLSEQKRTVLEDLKKSQKGLQDAQKFFGDAAVDALEDLIINGAKAEDVMKRLAASLAKAALQAALMGSGPLAGLFGTSGTGGNVGGLFGMLFGGIGKNANGGWINGPGSGRSDSILSWVSNGEHITNARSAKKYAPLLDAINADRLPRFASGGVVGMPNLSTPKVRAIAPRAAGAGGVVVNVTNNTPAQVETKPRADGGVDMIIRQVEGALAQRMLRGHGSLSQALTAKATNRHLTG